MFEYYEIKMQQPKEYTLGESIVANAFTRAQTDVIFKLNAFKWSCYVILV